MTGMDTARSHAGGMAGENATFKREQAFTRLSRGIGTVAQQSYRPMKQQVSAVGALHIPGTCGS